MDELSGMPPRVMACALVGMFLQEWAFMESRLRSLVGKALGLDEMQAAILASNMQLRDKIHVARTIIGTTPLQDEKRTAYRRILQDISDYSPTRNMMAHDVFGETEDGKGVTFFVVKAKGAFSIPDTVWYFPQFEEAYLKVHSFYEALKEMENALVDVSRMKSRIMAEMLSHSPESELIETGPSNHQSRPLQGAPDYFPDQASDENETQRPPDPKRA
ncbi:MAG: hypothetical protein KG075_05510 [Alphaproteobacteria bacterium]|nr:hypothetical protein [Alphaproteobacteria bacterium]